MHLLRYTPIVALAAFSFLGCSSSTDAQQAPPIIDEDVGTDAAAEDSAGDSSNDSPTDSTAPDSAGPDSSDSSSVDSSSVDSSSVDSAVVDSSSADSSTIDAGADAPIDSAPPSDGSVPSGYENLAQLSNQALITALHDLIDGQKSVGYDAAKGILFENPGIDIHNGKIECIYSGQLFDPSKLDKGGGFNTEHSWPQSQFGGESSTAKGDMHHLFPTEISLNSCRSSNDFGEVVTFSTSCTKGGSGLGKNASGSNVFLVRPKYRGDIARAHFYFAVRYQLHIGAAEESTLRGWHHEDVPDVEEQTRNTAIYNIQKNRNPFVDWPEAADRIADF